ncbi:Phenoloxidase-activating factor 2 (Fragment) [Anthophora quadrimaculata]
MAANQITRTYSIAMWRVLFTLALASYSLGVPAPQQTDNKFEDLISSVFGTGPQTTQATQPSVVEQTSNGNLDSLVDNVFGNSQSSTTPVTILGTQNRPTKPTEDCECVKYYLCREGTILENGMGVIDIRGLGSCADYLEVCCKAPNRTEPGQSVTPPPIQRNGCGQRHADGVGFRITGNNNNEAQFGEFPWMVAILKEEAIGDNNQKLNVYQCGGSLIHAQAVLTAAHCVQGKQPSELRVRAGEWDTQTKNEIFPHQDRTVKNVVIHDKYYAGALYYDFAILILSEPMNLMENVDVACLPDRNAVFDGSRCFASGWGKDVFGQKGHYQVILKKVQLPVVPHAQCQENLRKTRLGKYFVLHDTFMCAGGESGIDTCKGDGGSPLVCPLQTSPGTYLQAGIVAWGIGCGDDGTPGVYANVATARDWIDEQMAFYNLDNTVYNPK